MHTQALRQSVRPHGGRRWPLAVLGLCLLVLSPRAPAVAEEPEADLETKVRALIAPIIKSERLVGLSVGIVDGEASTILHLGRTSVDGDTAPSDSTLYEIGSISKVFTGILLGHAVADGKTLLTTPVTALLPESLAALATKGRPIQLLDLTTHSSGLPRMPTNFRPADPKNPYVDYGSERLFAFLADWEPTHEPGTRHEYSNLAVGLLGTVLARRAKTSYEKLLIATIAEPLGMHATRIQARKQDQPKLARPHHKDTTPSSSWEFTSFAGAGAIRSTVPDMMCFLRAALKPPKTPLGVAMTLSMKQHRQVKGNARMGLGWHIGGSGLRWHNGQTGGYHSYLAVDQAKQRAVVLLSNTASGLVDRIGNDILKMLDGKAVTPRALPATAAVTAEVMDGLVGRYRLTASATFTITRTGRRLMVQLTGQPAWRIFPTSETEWTYRVVPAQITFVKNGDGETVHLVVHQNGRDLTAPRLRDD